MIFGGIQPKDYSTSPFWTYLSKNGIRQHQFRDLLRLSHNKFREYVMYPDLFTLRELRIISFNYGLAFSTVVNMAMGIRSKTANWYELDEEIYNIPAPSEQVIVPNTPKKIPHRPDCIRSIDKHAIFRREYSLPGHCERCDIDMAAQTSGIAPI